jgi:hypothetical protein
MFHFLIVYLCEVLAGKDQMSDLEGIFSEDSHPLRFLVETAALVNQMTILVKVVMVKMEAVVIWLDSGIFFL